MTTLEKLNENKELQKNISKLNYYTTENFINDAKAYIKAIKDGRMINVIGSVSNSGMSRTMKFTSCEKNTRQKRYYQRQYTCLFISLGYSEGRNKDGYFSIGGCGMDMVFSTNYNNIHRLQSLGFMSKKECAKLCQMTPNTI